MKTSTKLLVLSLLALTTIGCFNFFSPSCVGEACSAAANSIKAVSTTPTPVVSPTPTPSTTPGLNCRIDFLVFDSGATSLSVNEKTTFSLTPWQRVETTGELVKVDDRCNIPRAEFVEWKVSSVVGRIVKLPGGFAAEVTRVGVGAFVVTASLEGRTVSREVN